jgi:SagB-type dehydrogenase family enzyme
MRTAATCTIALTIIAVSALSGADSPPAPGNPVVKLPPAPATGTMPLEQAIAKRRSVRRFTPEPLTLQQIGQLCWAAQGITDSARGFRAAPSAGALYPIELYVLSADGVDHYRPKDHSLERIITGDQRKALQRAGLKQESIGSAPVCFVVTAAVERTARKYGDRAERYCLLEAGHVAQNILLQATALDLAGVPIGASDDHKIAALLRLPDTRVVAYLIPIGHPKH